jgi:hypothetical protein
MATLLAPISAPGRPWTASPEAVQGEITRLRAVEFFSLESYQMSEGKLMVIGTLSHKRPHCGLESLRVRLEYPLVFPLQEPRVFDHHKVFVPGLDGHQFQDYGLCLRFPAREEFSRDIEVLGREVLGAALSWMVKRNIFERNKSEGWPGEAEPHGWAAPYRQLVVEELIAGNHIFLSIWAEWAMRTSNPARPHGPCPCLSGRTLNRCHKRIAELVDAAIYHTVREAGIYGRR